MRLKISLPLTQSLTIPSDTLKTQKAKVWMTVTHSTTKKVNNTRLPRPKRRFYKTALVTAMSSVMLLPLGSAYAETNTDTDVNSADPALDSTNAAAAQKDEDLHQVLDALHLKKAVENGLVDASVLEAYQQETIDKASNPKPRSKKATSTKTSSTNSSSNPPKTAAVNSASNREEQAAVASQSDSSQPNNPRVTAPQASASRQSRPAVADISEDSADSSPPDSAMQLISEDSLNQQAEEVQRSGYQMMSPAEIDSQLGVVDSLVQRAAQFDAPVATLDSNEAPLGLDSELDAAKLPTPSNLETLGVNDTVAEDATDRNTGSTSVNEDNVTNAEADVLNRPIQVSDAVSSGQSEGLNGVNDITERQDPELELAKQSSNQVKGSDQAQIVDSHIEAARQADGENSDSQASADINPEDFLPDYQATSESDALAESIEKASDDTTSARSDGNIFKRLYNRYFNDGYSALPRINATVYLEQGESNSSSAKLIKADKNIQPINNIKAALEDITVQSVADFTGALPRLRQTALNAAKAVGYYDVALRLRRQSDDDIDVIIERLGEPVIVDNRVIDIRGEGGDTPEFQALEESLPPHSGEVFNHGVYKTSKAAIETLSSNQGYFDKYWLNKSVDIILPDNTADVDLIYNTGERYKFDDVVFFTYDEASNELTRDPNKLPIKPELLRQLLSFKSGDPYYLPNITKLSNDLSATRYFNTVNVEVILPTDAIDTNATLGFDSSVSNDNSLDDNEDISILNAENPADTIANSTVENDANLTAKSDVPADENPSKDTVDEQDIAPIDFQVDEQTHEKLIAIQQKAERLVSLPDDRVLDEQGLESKSLLGRISDSISSIAKKILPDGDDEVQALKPEKLSGRITPEEVKRTKQVPLYVYVSSEKPRDAQVGIGYGTDTGVRATAKVDYNLINRDGYQAGFEVAASRMDKNATIYASRPWKHPLNDTLNASLSYREETLDKGEGSFDLSTNTVEASLTRNIRREEGWNRTYSIRYHHDELETSVDEARRSDLPVRFTSSKPTQEALLLGYGMSKLDVDNVNNPTKGIRQYYGIEAGADGVLTDTNMAIARAGVRGIYSFGESNEHQVIGRFEGGYLWADDFYDVPYNLRFLAGGDQSIRGYDYKSLSPIEKGYLTGGQVLAVGSAEYNYEFRPGFRAAVFTDVGNAYDTDFETDTKIGVGTGIRWASPIGVVRLDVAAGVTEESIPVRLYFFIGSPL